MKKLAIAAATVALMATPAAAQFIGGPFWGPPAYAQVPGPEPLAMSPGFYEPLAMSPGFYDPSTPAYGYLDPDPNVQLEIRRSESIGSGATASGDGAGE